MKVLLIQSYLGANEPLVFPIGLACIKSAVKFHDVSVFDMNTSNNPFEDLQIEIDNFKPDVVGISLRNIDSTNKREVVFYYKHLKDTVKIIKRSAVDKIIIGGSGYSIYAKEVMQDEPDIDFGVYLEGEYIFPQLLENLNSPNKVKSVYYRKNGRIFFSGSNSGPNLNLLTIPDRGSAPLEKYKKFKDSIGVETKRGCALKCIYCVYPFLNGRNYRLRKPSLVVDDIKDLVSYGTERFMFVDSVFNIPKKHAEDICKEIIKRRINVKWSAWLNEKHITRDFIELMKEAGCDNVMMSPDAIADITLSKLGKNLCKKEVLKAYYILKKINGLEISYNFFINPPGQNLFNFLFLVLFCLKAKFELKKRIHFEFNSLRVEPYTRLYDIAVNEGVVKEGENLLYPKNYTNKKTLYIERIFNVFLRLKGK